MFCFPNCVKHSAYVLLKNLQ